MKTFKEFVSENESIFTGNSRVNLPGSLESNIIRHEQHLKDSGHAIKRSEELLGNQHWIVSTKGGKEYHHIIKSHPDNKWTTIETKIQ